MIMKNLIECFCLSEMLRRFLICFVDLSKKKVFIKNDFKHFLAKGGKKQTEYEGGNITGLTE
jgi:hypothetical protein